MKKNYLSIIVSVLSILFTFSSCEKEIKTLSPYIDGLSISNFPTIDGSTSTLPLNTVIACELMGLGYEWKENEISWSSSMWGVEPMIRGSLKKKFNRVILSSQTHQSFINVIDKTVDIALVARAMSADEKEYAASLGVTLIETPIALDALILIVNPQNKVTGLTTQNIQDIYTGKITDWNELGIELPYYSAIDPFIRNPNSGSQELMDLLIMKDLDYINLPVYEENLVFTMAGLLDKIGQNRNAIGYTVYYYNEFIIRPKKEYLKTIAIDGVFPNENTITNRIYPYTTEVYAVMRADTDENSMTYKVHEWLQTPSGKQAISKSGYIPN